MLTLVCDLCERAIKDTGYICDLIEAKLVLSDDARPRMAERGRILSLYTCTNCANKSSAAFTPCAPRQRTAGPPANALPPRRGAPALPH